MIGHANALIFLLISLFITSSDPYFGLELNLVKTPTTEINDFLEVPLVKKDRLTDFLSDKDSRVSDDFSIPPYFYTSVEFWFLIYTQFESSSIIIHDKNNLSIIYKVLDFNPLKKKGFGKNIFYILQQNLAQEKTREIKNDLNYLALNPEISDDRSKRILLLLTRSGVSIPDKPSLRSKLFQQLRDNVRTQTGQKDFIREGIVRSMPYQQFLNSYFARQKLPKELLAIPFLESSFNPRAQSKVNALGAWQFMPLISSYFVPSSKSGFDYRFNVGVSSIAASFLMKENFQILKSWDLAVTAYNSGTKHLVKTKKELNKSKVSLEEVIRHSDSKHFGFASKNFYSEFLALVHALAYQEELFENIHSNDRSDVKQNLRFYLSKCRLKFNEILNEFHRDDVLFHNHHTKSGIAFLPRGVILTTKSQLPGKYFFEIPDSILLSKKPKDWIQLFSHQSCSTR